MSVSIFSPAKINLYLAVTGRRGDGYHDLVSVAAPLDFGDELNARIGKAGASGQNTLSCEHPEVPVDETNLVLKAARAYGAATGWKQRVDFTLTKRIPVGAGLGGGSSNAVAALRAMDRLAGGILAGERMAEIAATLGSDCPLFLANAPVVMRGRGERVERLPNAARLAGRRVLLFKPGFAISTAWAYGRLALRSDYLPAADAEARLAAWLRGAAPAEELLFNNMEAAAFEKFVALPVLMTQLRTEFGLAPRLSGSGSACYALLRDDLVTASVVEFIRGRWGPAAFVQEARIV